MTQPGNLSAAPVPAAAPAASSPEVAGSKELQAALEGWSAAWSKREADTYVGFYAPGFVPSTGGDRETWKEKRKAVLASASDISVEVSDLTLVMPDAGRASTTFKQTYRSANYRDVVTKTLQWVRVGERWLILRETSVTPPAGIQ